MGSVKLTEQGSNYRVFGFVVFRPFLPHLRGGPLPELRAVEAAARELGAQPHGVHRLDPRDLVSLPSGKETMYSGPYRV